MYSYSIFLNEPSKKKGWYHYYRKNNVLSKSLYYNSGEVDSIKTYHQDENPFESYYKAHLDFIYVSVINKEGNDILDENGSGEISIYDSIMNRAVIKTYEHNQLKAVYYLKDNSKHYLLTEEPASYKFFSKFSDKFNKEFKLKNKEKTSFLDGLTLINCVIDKDGRIVDASIRLSANPKNDQKISNWMKSYNGKAFKPAKLDGNAQQQEILIPIKYKAYTKDKYKIKTSY